MKKKSFTLAILRIILVPVLILLTVDSILFARDRDFFSREINQSELACDVKNDEDDIDVFP